MPRYYFHLENGERVLDRVGQELPDDSAALRVAVGVVAALRRRGRTWRVVVTNERGHEVSEIPVALEPEG
jgi:hypothetical protein